MNNSNSTTTRRGQQRDKPFRDALRMEAALAERSEPTPAPPGSLRSIARNLLDRADKCTLAAREVADRLDGKSIQQTLVSSEKHVATDWTTAELEAWLAEEGGCPPRAVGKTNGGNGSNPIH
jgi:hypothetical protein